MAAMERKSNWIAWICADAPSFLAAQVLIQQQEHRVPHTELPEADAGVRGRLGPFTATVNQLLPRANSEGENGPFKLPGSQLAAASGLILTGIADGSKTEDLGLGDMVICPATPNQQILGEEDNTLPSWQYVARKAFPKFALDYQPKTTRCRGRLKSPALPKHHRSKFCQMLPSHHHERRRR